MKNVIIGLGNTGTNIVNLISQNANLSNTSSLYCVDSTTCRITLDSINDIKYLCTISDDVEGSGRNRERGCALFQHHETMGTFDEMYKDASAAKSPVIVITSSAGGTGSGSAVPLCKSLIEKGIEVIPIIIVPNLQDPDAYHLNTSDLFIGLDEAGVTTYSVFRNSRGDADYTPINKEVVELIEIILGKKYDTTNLDSIDDSDLDVILSTPGRFVAVSVSAPDTEILSKDLTRKIFSGFQPAWTQEESSEHTFMTAYSLSSMFAKQDFKRVFEELNNRIVNVYDEYRNICDIDNDGVAKATVIVAGLPRPEIKQIDSEYKESKAIADGINKSKRPKFLNKKKAVIQKDDNAISQFKWK